MIEPLEKIQRCDDMNRILLAATCEDVRREEEGKVSLMGLFDSLKVVDFARPLPSFHVFGQVGFESRGTHSVVVAIRSEDGEFALELQRRVEATVEAEGEGLFIAEFDWKLDALRLPKPGRYRIYFVTDLVQELAGPCFMAKASPPVAVATSRSHAQSLH